MAAVGSSGLFFLMLTCPALAGMVRYDQTQTGDYNVHLDLKNIEVLAFLDGGSLSLNDYEYDYNDYTLKPPSSNSSAQNASFSVSDSSSAANSNSSSNSSTDVSPSKPSNGTDTSERLEPQQAESSSEHTETSTKPARRCGAGFYRDQNGRCRRLRRPIKLSGLLQKATNRISG